MTLFARRVLCLDINNLKDVNDKKYSHWLGVLVGLIADDHRWSGPELTRDKMAGLCIRDAAYVDASTLSKQNKK